MTLQTVQDIFFISITLKSPLALHSVNCRAILIYLGAFSIKQDIYQAGTSIKQGHFLSSNIFYQAITFRHLTTHSLLTRLLTKAYFFHKMPTISPRPVHHPIIMEHIHKDIHPLPCPKIWPTIQGIKSTEAGNKHSRPVVTLAITELQLQRQ